MQRALDWESEHINLSYGFGKASSPLQGSIFSSLKKENRTKQRGRSFSTAQFHEDDEDKEEDEDDDGDGGGGGDDGRNDSSGGDDGRNDSDGSSFSSFLSA